jgi:hypothetical protein
MTNLKQKFREKEGIAFIITLGLLAVLMVLGVSFAVYMKVEREAAGNFALVGSCRQLALAGVAYAMDDISFSLDEDPDDDDFYWYPKTNGWCRNNTFYGWFTSTAESGYDSLKSKLYSNNKLAKELIPEQTFYTARKIYSIDRLNTFDIFDDGEFADVDKDIDGKFNGNASYIVVNLSGVLDPNFAGGKMTRTSAGTPDEFSLQDFPGIISTNNFFTDREDMEWYETIGEIEDINEAESLPDPGDTIDVDKLKALYPFSFFYSDSDSSKLVVANTEAQLLADMSKLNKIAAALKNDANVEGSVDAAYANANVRFATLLNLLDYLDDDNKPGGLPQFETIFSYKSPCVEPFPMINEVFLNTKFITTSANNADPYRYTMLTTLNIELWYPFVSPTCEDAFPDGFDLEYTIHFGTNQLETTTSGSPVLNLLPDKSSVTTATQNTGKPREWTETISFKSSDFDDKVIAGNEAIVYLDPTRKFNFLPRSTALTNITSNLKPNNSMIISVDIKIKEKGTAYDDDSNTFDGFDPAENDGVNYMLQFEVPLAIDGTKQLLDTDFDKQVVDPRLNYKATHDGLDWWVDVVPANNNNIGKINTVTANEWAKDVTDNDGKMFIKGFAGNPASLESIGEFGYIFTGRPWETVRLLDRTNNVSRHLIYENFILASNTNITSGCANINTEYEEVLRAALKDMPMLPDRSVTPPLTTAQLDSLVDKIQTLTADGGISPTNLFESAAQTAIFTALGLDETKATEFEKEAFYISGYPALRSDQNLFAIFSMGHYYASKQICMAIVWRDPVPDENGNHACFIRELTWLNGE